MCFTQNAHFFKELAMAEKQIVGSMSDWSGVLKDLFRQIDDGSITLFNVKEFVEHRNPFAVPDIDWKKTYKTLGMEAEYTKFVKEHKVKKDPNLWIAPVIKGVTINKIVAVMRALLQKEEPPATVYAYTEDLDADISADKSDRHPDRDGSYLVAFRRTVEADEKNKNLSADILKAQGHKGITALERKLLGLGYFVATGKHLDVKTTTLCSGSRNRYGYVPYVYWSSDDRKVYVNDFNPANANDNLRSRSVVSSDIPPA